MVSAGLASGQIPGELQISKGGKMSYLTGQNGFGLKPVILILVEQGGFGWIGLTC